VSGYKLEMSIERLLQMKSILGGKISLVAPVKALSTAVDVQWADSHAILLQMAEQIEPPAERMSHDVVLVVFFSLLSKEREVEAQQRHLPPFQPQSRPHLEQSQLLQRLVPRLNLE
jgi:hypothetical protein